MTLDVRIHGRGGQGVVTAAELLSLAASDLSRERLGRPLPNTALIGAVVALTGVVELPALHTAIRHRFASSSPEVVAANLRLAADAHDLTRGWERGHA